MSNFSKRGVYVADYPISGSEKYIALKFLPDINRERKISHVNKMRGKINVYGWCDIVKITKNGSILEGQHRVEAAILEDETTVPVYILTWVDDADEDDVREVITSLNNGQKSWNLFDWTKTFKNKNAAYKLFYDKLLKGKDFMSNGVIFTIYTGKKTLTSFPDFTNGNFNGFKNLELSNMLMSRFMSWVERYGKSKFPPQTLRSLASKCFNEKIEGVVDYVLKDIENVVKLNGSVPEGDSQFSEYYDEVKEKYLSVFNSVQ